MLGRVSDVWCIVVWNIPFGLITSIKFRLRLKGFFFFLNKEFLLLKSFFNETPTKIYLNFLMTHWFEKEIQRDEYLILSVFSPPKKASRNILLIGAWHHCVFSLLCIFILTRTPADARPFISARVSEAAQGEPEMDDLTLQTRCLPNKSWLLF